MENQKKKPIAVPVSLETINNWGRRVNAEIEALGGKPAMDDTMIGLVSYQARVGDVLFKAVCARAFNRIKARLNHGS